ncbi:hypothetical protein [Sphingopyxis sp. LK2115]|uniref:hypothetical protein n=1 Tax=Sphingopyxis sp. LK2115 TaxID=2744558 RepID=UPI00166041DA|nr:hypothetical protein [Sphingopyxis sp. LK2115]
MIDPSVRRVKDEHWRNWLTRFPDLRMDLSGDRVHAALSDWLSSRPETLPSGLDDRARIREILIVARSHILAAAKAQPISSGEAVGVAIGTGFAGYLAPGLVKAWKIAALIEPVTAGAVGAAAVPIVYALVQARRIAYAARKDRMFRQLIGKLDSIRGEL